MLVHMLGSQKSHRIIARVLKNPQQDLVLNS